MWRLASRRNISWRLASTELKASASTGFFDVALACPHGTFFANLSTFCHPMQIHVCLFVSNTRIMANGIGKTFSMISHLMGVFQTYLQAAGV